MNIKSSARSYGKAQNSSQLIDNAETMEDLHGWFFGVTHASSRIEGLICAHVPKTNINNIAESYLTKWWDYRQMSPGHCFMLLVDNYHSAFKTHARKLLRYKKQDPTRVALLGYLLERGTVPVDSQDPQSSQKWGKEPVNGR